VVFDCHFAARLGLLYIRTARVPANERSKRMPRKFLGITVPRWVEYSAAILLGDAIYYFSLVPHLPQALRHREFLLDWGSAVDFVVCLGVYGLIGLGRKL
jgi:hypothetical protein